LSIPKHLGGNNVIIKANRPFYMIVIYSWCTYYVN